jgi:hypothetical protein
MEMGGEPCSIDGSGRLLFCPLFLWGGGGERFIVKKVCTACSRTSHKIVPLNNMNKYLCNDKSEIKENTSINNSSEEF